MNDSYLQYLTRMIDDGFMTNEEAHDFVMRLELRDVELWKAVASLRAEVAALTARLTNHHPY